MTTTEEYIDVRARVGELGCALGNTLTFLPSNFETAETADDFVVRGEITTIRKVLNAGGVATMLLSAEAVRPPRFVHNKSHDWAVPMLFIGFEVLKTTPDLVGVTLDLIRDYAASLFQGTCKDRQVKAEIVVESDEHRSYQKITYEGDVTGLGTLAEMVAKIHANDKLPGNH